MYRNKNKIGYRAIPSWFSVYRNTAQGIFNSCHPVGGIILPLLVNQVNAAFGHAWQVKHYLGLCYGIKV